MSATSSIKFDLITDTPFSVTSSGDGVNFHLEDSATTEKRSTIRVLNTPRISSAPPSPSSIPDASAALPVSTAPAAPAPPPPPAAAPAAPASTAVMTSSKAPTRATARSAAADEVDLGSASFSSFPSRHSTASARSEPRVLTAGQVPASTPRSTARASSTSLPISPERRREILEHGGPTTRGRHSLNPLAPDASRDPPDVQGPPRYLRSRGVTPVHSARARSGGRRRGSGSGNGSDGEGKKKPRRRRGEKATKGRRRDGGESSSGGDDDDGDGDEGKAKGRRKSSKAAPFPGATIPGHRASILAPPDDELTNATMDNGIGFQQPAFMGGGGGYASSPPPPLPLDPWQLRQQQQPSMTTTTAMQRRASGSAYDGNAGSGSPLRQPPPRSHSPGGSHAVTAVPDTQRPTLSCTRPAAPSPQRLLSFSGAQPSPASAPRWDPTEVAANQYAKPRLVELEESGAGGLLPGGPSGAPHAANQENNRHSINAPSPSSFLSDIRRSPTSLNYQRYQDTHPSASGGTAGGGRAKVEGDSSLPDGLNSSLLLDHKLQQEAATAGGPPPPQQQQQPQQQPPQLQGSSQRSGMWPLPFSAHSEVYPHAFPWDKTKLPASASNNGVDDSATNHGAGLDPWEVEMARRALEQFPPLSRGSDEAAGMTAFVVVVKRMPQGIAVPSQTAEEGPCVVRVFVPSNQLARVTVTHVKLELQRQLGVPVKYQDLRTEGVRLLDELPLELLDPQMVLFADFSSAPPEAVAQERRRQQCEQLQQAQQQQQEEEEMVASSQGRRRSHNGRERPTPSVPIYQRGAHKQQKAQKERHTASHIDPHSPSIATGGDDAVSEHIRRLRDLLGLDDAELATPHRHPPAPPPPHQSKQGTLSGAEAQAHLELQRQRRQSLRPVPLPPPSVPSDLGATPHSSPSSVRSSSSSSLDSLSTNSPSTRARRFARHAAAAGTGAVKRAKGSSYLTTDRRDADDDNGFGRFRPVAYSTAHFSEDSIPLEREQRGSSTTLRNPRPFAFSETPAAASAETGTEASRRGNEANVVFMGSVVRPFQLRATPLRPAAGSLDSNGDALVHSSVDRLPQYLSPKQTTVAAMSTLPVPPLRFYRGHREDDPRVLRAPAQPPSSTATESNPGRKTEAFRQHPPQQSKALDQPGGVAGTTLPDSLVAYPVATETVKAPTSTSASVARRSSPSPSSSAAMPTASFPFNTTTSQSLAAAAAAANTQSRERMRQALALEAANDALSFAAAARQRLNPPRNRTVAQEGKQTPPASKTATVEAVHAADFPVPEEGGVSPSDFSSLDHSLDTRTTRAPDAGNNVNTTRAPQDRYADAMNGDAEEQAGRRNLYHGISAVDTAVADRLLSRVQPL